MNLKNKRTVLSDDAALYSHREDVSEKEKWETMTQKERWQYFVDYYLGKIVIIIIVVASLISIAYTILKPRAEIMLSVAIADDAVNQEIYDNLQAKLNEVMGLDGETKDTTFDTGYSLVNGDYQSWQKYAIYNMVGDLDVTILPKSAFEETAPGDYFSPVASRISGELYTALEPYMLEITLQDEEGNLVPDSKAMYGIDISSTWLYENVQTTEPMILVINAAPKHAGNIEALIKLLFFPDDAK